MVIRYGIGNKAILIAFLLAAFLVGCGEGTTSEMSQYAANEEVARFMENYEGRGVLTDPESRPTPPEEALAGFRYPDDLSFEIVLSEPDIIQPLQISFDHRGRLWVVQYHQYPYPEGLKITEIDNHTRVKFDKIPEAPPGGVKGADKITFFEDTDGDGKYDKATDAVTGLNIATAVALGRERVWVLNPPYLLAYPDVDGDGLPDGEPEVHLEGFGLEDTHAVANSLTWGPDGWLYGAQGSTTTANINSGVSKNVSFLGQAIWRYHPETQVFEIFAEGGGNNAFNLEFDNKGRIYSGSNGYGRGPYYKQGAYYIKSWGKHGPLTNPYAFGYLPNMPLEGENKRFTHSLVKYEAGSMPDAYQNMMFAVNPLHNYVQLTEFQPLGSSFKNVDRSIVLETDDKWFRPVDIKVGPDGGVYISDWYDSRLSHVDPRDTWHKSSGRIYRLIGKGQDRPVERFDLGAYSSTELVGLLSHENKWFRQQALRQFGDRKDSSVVPELIHLMETGDGQEALEALWALNLSGGFTDALAVKALQHEDAFVRMWAIRLLGDAGQVSSDISAHLVRLASKEPHPEVRGQLASTAKRLPAEDAFPIILNLLRHHNDEDDPDIPLLIWWAIESKAASDRDKLIALFEDAEMWNRPIVKNVVLHRLMQRYIMEGGDANYTTSAMLLNLAPSDEHAGLLINGMQEGLLGTDISEISPALSKALEPYGGLGEAPLTLAIRQGNEEAIEQAILIVEDPNEEIGLRLSYIQTLGEIAAQKSMPVLLKLVQSGQSTPGTKQAALNALQGFADEDLGKRIAAAYPAFRDVPFVREAGIAFFASRVPWALDFLREIDQTKTISPDDVPYHLARRFRLLDDPQVDDYIDKLWPQSQLMTSAEKTKQINAYERLLTSSDGDLVNGHVLYMKNCGSCHRLHREGGLLGPELTGYDRSDLQYMLLHTVDPHADIREGYEVQRIELNDGRVLEGRLKSQSGGSITVEPPLGGPAVTFSMERVEEMAIMQTSFMPERILEKLSDQEVKDLFAYLMSEKP